MYVSASDMNVAACYRCLFGGQIASWDCFGGTKFMREVIAFPKQSHSAIRYNAHPVLTRNHKMAERRLSTNVCDYFKIKFFLVLGDVS